MPEPFRPIHFPVVFEDTQEDQFKESKENEYLAKEIETMRNTISSLERELHECMKMKHECMKMKEELISLNSKLEEENKALLAKSKDLEATISELTLSMKTFEKLTQALSSYFSRFEQKLREDLKEIAINIAKQLYLTDKLPKEEAIAKGLQKALSSGLSIGGMVRVFLNPKDYGFVEEFLSKLGDELKNVKIELVKKDDVNRGDFLIETSDFWIERNLDKILEEIEEEL